MYVKHFFKNVLAFGNKPNILRYLFINFSTKNIWNFTHILYIQVLENIYFHANLSHYLQVDVT